MTGRGGRGHDDWSAREELGRRGEGTEGGVGSHYVEGGDVTDGDGWLHVRQV